MVSLFFFQEYKNYSDAEAGLVNLADLAKENGSQKKESQTKTPSKTNTSEPTGQNLLYSTKEDLDNFLISPSRGPGGFMGTNSGMGTNSMGVGMGMGTNKMPAMNMMNSMGGNPMMGGGMNMMGGGMGPMGMGMNPMMMSNMGMNPMNMGAMGMGMNPMNMGAMGMGMNSMGGMGMNSMGGMGMMNNAQMGKIFFFENYRNYEGEEVK